MKKPCFYNWSFENRISDITKLLYTVNHHVKYWIKIGACFDRQQENDIVLMESAGNLQCNATIYKVLLINQGHSLIRRSCCAVCLALTSELRNAFILYFQGMTF